MSNVNDPISRRRALALGGSLAGGLAVASSPLLGAPGRALAATARGGIDVTGKTKNDQLPVQQIETMMPRPLGKRVVCIQPPRPDRDRGRVSRRVSGDD